MSCNLAQQSTAHWGLRIELFRRVIHGFDHDVHAAPSLGRAIESPAAVAPQWRRSQPEGRHHSGGSMSTRGSISVGYLLRPSSLAPQSAGFYNGPRRPTRSPTRTRCKSAREVLFYAEPLWVTKGCRRQHG